MKVRELIQALQGLDQEAEIVIEEDLGSWAVKGLLPFPNGFKTYYKGTETASYASAVSLLNEPGPWLAWAEAPVVNPNFGPNDAVFCGPAAMFEPK